MATDILRTPAFLSPGDTLSVTSKAPAILKSLLPPAIPLPYPLSLLTSTETPEKWTTYEHLLLACLKTGDDRSAFLCIEALTARFTKDNERVCVLRGLYREAVATTDAELEQILADYEATIEAYGGWLRLRKRRVGLLKSLGRTAEAMRALLKIVDTSPTDAEAWAELADMYADLGLWDQAVYCLEEVLLVAPNAWNMHARLAEVEWMWAETVEDMREKTRLVSSSFRRYCRSIELCDDYLRGYYGLKLTSGRLLQFLGGKGSNGFDASTPPQPAVESLNEIATAKLAEIVRRGAANERGWDGYDEAELIAARELLDRDVQQVPR